MAEQRVLTPAERAQYFAQATRQNWQMLPSKTAAAGENVSFDLPQVRLASKIYALITATFTAKHPTETKFDLHPLAPLNLIDRVEINVNNGFAPFRIKGQELFMVEMMSPNADTTTVKNTGRGAYVVGNTVSASGATNRVSFLVELPLTLNERDPIGLIMTQNKETTVTVDLRFAQASALAATTAGFTFDIGTIKVQPMVESYTIPQQDIAKPDISMLKLVHANNKNIPGPGEVTVTLPTGLTYRRLVLYITDENGKGVSDADLNGNLEILLNQADRPYVVDTALLAAINTKRYGRELPVGMYAIDLTYQGIANYGGMRDYIDTERLTEFEIKFQTKKGGNVSYVYEVLSQLRTATASK